jgi:hypothetical protein
VVIGDDVRQRWIVSNRVIWTEPPVGGPRREILVRISKRVLLMPPRDDCRLPPS